MHRLKRKQVKLSKESNFKCPSSHQIIHKNQVDVSNYVKMIQKTSYIICFREGRLERRTHLLFVLSYLRKCFSELEIIVVEQDEKPKLKLPDGLVVKYVFHKNGGLFNRSQAFNTAVEHTDKELFAFGDADIFLTKEDYRTCFEAINEFEAVTPNQSEAINVAIADEPKYQFEILNVRPIFTFAGGLMMISRRAFNKIGGWDERFEGWGGEDFAMSHLACNKLTTKAFGLTLYHIDHHRSITDGPYQKKYRYNRYLAEEVLANNGSALESYIKLLRQQRIAPLVKKELTFVLAVTFQGQIKALKLFIASFLGTITTDTHWKVVISSAGSMKGTENFIKELRSKYEVTLINEVNEVRGANRKLKILSETEFDLCFFCTDNIQFKKEGWDKAYWKAVKRTGFGHLVFHDRNQIIGSEQLEAFRIGHLVSWCRTENIQTNFFTLTKEMINAVGYFDEHFFGTSNLWRKDYIYRSCRAGFNIFSFPLDIADSNDFLQLTSYSIPKKPLVKFKSKGKVSKTNRAMFEMEKIIFFNRKYLPYNENLHKFNTGLKTPPIISASTKTLANKKYRKTYAAFNPKKGVKGFIGFLFKKLYNCSIDLNLFFIPGLIRKTGKVLNNVSQGLLNIGK